MKQPATITLNESAIAQIAAAITPHIERLLDERLSRKNASTIHGGPRLLRFPAVSNLTGLKRSALYRKVYEGTFPKPMKLGQRMVAWREEEVRAWINQQTIDE